MKTLRVKAAPGRKVPIHSSVARAPGGRQLIVDGDTEFELPDVSFIRRRIAVGDLVVVEAESPRGLRREIAGHLDGGGPPAVFGDLPPFDPTNPGPHIRGPKKES